jgi:hypothetical protein
MYSLPPTFYPSNNCSRQCNLAFRFGSDAATGEVYYSLPGGPTDGHCALYQRVLVCGVMTLTAPVDDLNSSAEGYRWYPNVPPLELRVSLRLHELGQEPPSLSVSGAEHPVLRHFGYTVLAFESTREEGESELTRHSRTREVPRRASPAILPHSSDEPIPNRDVSADSFGRPERNRVTDRG